MNLLHLPLLVLACVPLLQAQSTVVTRTEGVPWPLPQRMACNKNHVFPFSGLSFAYGGQCALVSDALKRWQSYIVPTGQHRHSHIMAALFHQQVDDFDYTTIGAKPLTLTIKLANDTCEQYPSFGMNEKYLLKVYNPDSTGNRSVLKADSVWGVLRGLATFAQIFLYKDQNSKNPTHVTPCLIQDWPRFSHRGLLLDTSRHFITLDTILTNLDIMEFSKFNVFHWHIVDDQSFPFYSQTFPDLSGKGAYTARHVYSQADVQNVIEYARQRGIRVMPEFDTPGYSLLLGIDRLSGAGHTQSWGKGVPGLLTECYSDDGKDTKSEALINPFLISSYDTLLALFTEILARFPDQYIHLGGDEVSYQYSCWLNNPEIQQMMALYNLTSGEQVENFYFQKFLPIVERARANTAYIVWQEVLDNKIQVRDDVIAHVWKGDNQQQIDAELADMTGRGHRALLSSCWYENYISYGSDWYTPYLCDPQHFNGTAAQLRLVVGGEACMWGEYVDATNVLSRTWPRTSFVGERLWSDRAMTNSTDAAVPRIEEHRCRMIRRGWPAEPVNGPSYCDVEYGWQ